MQIAQITLDGRVFLDNGEELVGLHSVSSRPNIMDDQLRITLHLEYSMHDIVRARDTMGPGMLPRLEGTDMGAFMQNTPQAVQTDLMRDRYEDALRRVSVLEADIARQGRPFAQTANLGITVGTTALSSRHVTTGPWQYWADSAGPPQLEPIDRNRFANIEETLDTLIGISDDPAPAIQEMADAGRTVIMIDGERQGYEA